MGFWEAYRILESATLLGLEDFLSDGQLKAQVKSALKQLLKAFLELAAEVSGTSREDPEEVVWQLASKGEISLSGLDDLLDVIRLIKDLDGVDDAIVYGMLVRCMEVIEEYYKQLEKRKDTLPSRP
jgi:hypothetical protein